MGIYFGKSDLLLKLRKYDKAAADAAGGKPKK